MNCPKCNSTNTRKRGKYNIKRSPVAMQRYGCNGCGASFSNQCFDYGKIPTWKRDQIKRLANLDKGFIKKYDPRKSNTYSTRDIAEKLKVSKTFVFVTLSKLK